MVEVEVVAVVGVEVRVEVRAVVGVEVGPVVGVEVVAVVGVEVGVGVGVVVEVEVEVVKYTMPSKKECYEAAEQFVKADHCKAAFYKGAKWLRDRIKPVERLSDEELEGVAGEFFKKTIDDLHADRWSFKKGYRAAEARILGEDCR